MKCPIPTKEEVVEFAKRMGLKGSVELFFNYHNDREWVVGGRKVVDWKALLVKWDQAFRVACETKEREKNIPKHRNFDYQYRSRSKEELNSVLSNNPEDFERLLNGGDEDE